MNPTPDGTPITALLGGTGLDVLLLVVSATVALIIGMMLWTAHDHPGLEALSRVRVLPARAPHPCPHHAGVRP
jgi:hypothetical protein